MSVLIKDMDMPKEGIYNAVITFDGDSISVRIPPSKKPFFSGRIVHMPKPHGRLIDADELLKNHAVIADKEFIHLLYRGTLRKMINKAPTIIEAEVE